VVPHRNKLEGLAGYSNIFRNRGLWVEALWACARVGKPTEASSVGFPGRGCRGWRASLDDDVAAGAAVEDVLAAVADEDVVAVAAEEVVVAGAADEDVVAFAAVAGQLDGVGG
jgi:hypothetical protein